MKPTVLVTATDALTRRDVADVLARFGYDTLTASSTTEALAMFADNRRIGVLVADVEAGGLPLAREARTLRPSIGVVYTSVAPYRVADSAKVSGAPLLRAPYAAHQLMGIIAGLGRRVLDDVLAA